MDTQRRDAFAGRLMGACTGALDLFHVYVGDRLGLYRAMASGTSLTPADLAERSGINERYAKEWLEQQAVAGIVDVSALPDDRRRYALPAEHAEVLTNEESLFFLSPLALGLVGVARALPEVVEAFKTGAGVPFESYGADIRDCIGRVNRPMFLNLLATEWFPKVPGLVERLTVDPPAVIADVGCGVGWASIAIALAFPKVRVHGLDLDPASIDEATANAERSGVGDRVTFEVRDAADPRLAGGFDLVCAFETIHDMCDPVGALRAMRSLRNRGGVVIVADERVSDTFTVEVEDGERFQWGWSALHCLPMAMMSPPSAGTGTIMRAPTFRRYATEAGFGDVEVLPIDNDFWRFYRLLD